MVKGFSAKPNGLDIVIVSYEALMLNNPHAELFKRAAKSLLRRLSKETGRPFNAKGLDDYLNQALGADPSKAKSCILLGFKFKGQSPATLSDLRPSNLVGTISYMPYHNDADGNPTKYEIANHYAKGQGTKVGTCLMWGALDCIKQEYVKSGLTSVELTLTTIKPDFYRKFDFLRKRQRSFGTGIHEYDMTRPLHPAYPLPTPAADLNLTAISLR